MIPFTMYTANSTGNAKNCIYPNEIAVGSLEAFKQAVRHDHVCAKYRDNRRSNNGFVYSDCIPMDCDNDHCEDPSQWKIPADVAAAFPDVSFAVCYSRSHMKEKNSKAARPKFHVYFPVTQTTDMQRYVAMKQQILRRFPWFDANAVDAARFCFGSDSGVEIVDGSKTVDKVLPEIIPKGSRNATMSQKAGCLIKRYGDTDEARAMFQVTSESCVPPLEQRELDAIWDSARKFGERVTATDGYIPPEQYNKSSVELARLHPESNSRYPWTDIGAGRLFADCYKNVVRYVPERKCWYCYSDGVWSADIGALQAMEYCKKLAGDLVLYALTIQDERQRQEYLKFCNKWQSRKVRETILKDAQGVHPIKMSEFDSDPYIFNCKNGTLHLDTMQFTVHDPSDMLTKISSVVYDPTARCNRFEQFIDEITSGDTDKAAFLQKALGYGMTGDTRYECLFFLYGASTRNGKGTLCDSVMNVLGGYGCTARPETISTQHSGNSSNPTEDIARLAGVRFVNISEPGRGLLLNAALIKSMTGNDILNARFLHENSFDFKPRFKMFINTNYMPVANDMTLFSSGRVIIIPFERHFDESEQDKSLKTEFAKPHNQSAILNWLIDGYRKLRENGFEKPESVECAINEYRKDSDKIAQFVEEKLEESAAAETRTSVVYDAYRNWCSENGFFTENSRNFNQSLRSIATVARKRPSTGGGATTLLLGYKISGAAQRL